MSIPGNDDAIRAVEADFGASADAVLEGKQGEQFELEEDALPEQEESRLLMEPLRFFGNPVFKMPAHRAFCLSLFMTMH